LDDKLYFPTSDELNDPTECLPIFADHSLEEITEYLCQQFRVDHPQLTNIELAAEEATIRASTAHHGEEVVIREMRRLFDKGMEGRYGILSLSKCKDSLSLWAHYGGNHSGYCLEFRNEAEFGTGYDVLYGDKAPLHLSSSAVQYQADFLFTKRPDWANEEEVRILVKPPGLHRFSPHLLVSIALGKDVSVENRYSVLEWVKSRRLPLRVCGLSFDRATGQLNRRPIT
jgi:hypothetical protein